MVAAAILTEVILTLGQIGTAIVGETRVKDHYNYSSISNTGIYEV